MSASFDVKASRHLQTQNSSPFQPAIARTAMARAAAPDGRFRPFRIFEFVKEPSRRGVE
jgi:hypothetical protein